MGVSAYAGTVPTLSLRCLECGLHFMMMQRILFFTTLMLSPVQAVEIIAHRGYSAEAPENTLAAFRLAWGKGADGCENDIHLTSDGQIVVLHDKDSKRTTGVTKVVAKTPAAELLALDAGSWKNPKWSGEKIPNLTQCLATLPEGKKRFFIEIKCGPEIVPALTRELEPLRDRSSQFAVISFNQPAAAEAKAAMPWLQVYLLASGKDKQKRSRNDLSQLIASAKADHLDGLNLGAEMVKQIRDAGLGVFVWTINNPQKAKQLATLGVDGITTDDPVMVRDAITSLAKP
jgi:glycerophosphoryl diester phosphodiesterase